MLKIPQARLQQYMNHKLPDVQAEFRKGREEPEIKLPTSKRQESYRKTSISGSLTTPLTVDCVDDNKLWKILQEMEIPGHLTCLLRNLYAGQEATVRTGHGTTYWFQIGKGVCQGCLLSPCLFNFYAEYIMRNTGLKKHSWNQDCREKYQ